MLDFSGNLRDFLKFLKVLTVEYICFWNMLWFVFLNLFLLLLKACDDLNYVKISVIN